MSPARRSVLRLAGFGFVLAGLILAAACQSELGYQESVDFGPGYRDREIAPGEFSVVVKGYPSTPPERVARLALLRAARLAVEQGRDAFVILDRIETTQQTSLMTTLFIPGPEGVALFVPVSVGTASEPIAFLLIAPVAEESKAPDALRAEPLIAEMTAQLAAEDG